MYDQCITVSKKANMILGLMSRNFDHKSSYVIKRLYSINEATLRIRDSVLVTTLKTRMHMNKYRDKRQNTFLHCVIPVFHNHLTNLSELPWNVYVVLRNKPCFSDLSEEKCSDSIWLVHISKVISLPWCTSVSSSLV